RPSSLSSSAASPRSAPEPAPEAFGLQPPLHGRFQTSWFSNQHSCPARASTASTPLFLPALRGCTKLSIRDQRLFPKRRLMDFASILNSLLSSWHRCEHPRCPGSPTTHGRGVNVAPASRMAERKGAGCPSSASSRQGEREGVAT